MLLSLHFSVVVAFVAVILVSLPLFVLFMLLLFLSCSYCLSVAFVFCCVVASFWGVSCKADFW